MWILITPTSAVDRSLPSLIIRQLTNAGDGLNSIPAEEWWALDELLEPARSYLTCGTASADEGSSWRPRKRNY
jgi:hypothetical protein